MKPMKKFFALLLVLTMALALGLPAFAADETGSITVDNPIADQTYTAYKIFDVTYDTGKTAYSYTISEASEWFETVKAYAEYKGGYYGLTLTQVEGTSTYVVTTTDSFFAPNFVSWLKDAVDGKTGTALTVTDGKAAVAGLPLGYYFVASSTGALCNLTTTDPDVTIHDKNDVPFTKTVDKHSFDSGNAITYTITTKVPDYTGWAENDNYGFIIQDEYGWGGLEFNGDFKVFIGDEDHTADCRMTNLIGNFMLNIPARKFPIGTEIKVIYTVTADRDAYVSKNEAKLFYGGSATIGPVSVSVYNTRIYIDKYALNTENPNNRDAKLSGAEFLMYKTDGDGDAATKLYYKWNGEEAKVEWTEDKDTATSVTTDETGAASFNGVADGTYYLEEITAPKGYNLLQKPVKVEVDGSASIDPVNPDTSVLTKTVSIANQTGAELPSTGGIGTTVFYVLGGLLAVGAAVLLITKKRMAEQ